MAKEQTSLRRLHDIINQHGWALMPIPDADPPFAFTIGLYKSYEHAEILMFTPTPSLVQVINEFGENVKRGVRYESGGLYELPIAHVPFSFQQIDPKYYDYYLGSAIRFYRGKGFPALQCVIPDNQGRFPSDVGCDVVIAETQKMRSEFRKSPNRLEDTTAPQTDKVGRNEPCPCGSAQKYKRCHGAAG